MQKKKEKILSRTRATALSAYGLGVMLGVVILLAYSAGQPGSSIPAWIQLIGITHGVVLCAVSLVGLWAVKKEHHKLEAISVPGVILSFVMITPAFFQSIFLGVFMGPASTRGAPAEGSSLFSFFYSSIFVYAAMIAIILVLSMTLSKRLVWLTYRAEGDPVVESILEEKLKDKNEIVEEAIKEIRTKKGGT